MSLRCFSILSGGIRNRNNQLNFPYGSTFTFNSYYNDDIATMLVNIQKDRTMFFGMEVQEVSIESNPDFSEVERFIISSPIYICRNHKIPDINGNLINKREAYIFDDAVCSELMTETIHRKMKFAGLPKDETLSISFDMEYKNPYTKLIHYNDIKNIVNWCPVIIKGKPETKEFAWNVGIGNSTGIGFGSLK